MRNALVIIPTYNEFESIAEIVERVRAHTDIDVLIVDDASPDGTGALADDIAANTPRVFVLHRTAKQGLGPAYIAGFRWAFARDYEWVAEMDADGSHDPAVLGTLVDIARGTDAALVIGSRWVAGGATVGWSRIREAISRAGNAYARLALGSHIRDVTAGFRVLRTDALAAVDLSTIASSGYCFQIEVAHRIEQTGATVIEHPIVFRERERGTSKMHTGIVAEALWRITGWGLRRLVGR
jgi:dolichol-phosphate mannosyltransferase